MNAFFFVDTYCHKSVLENIKCSEKVTNEQVLDHIEEKRTLINNILSRKANWIGHNLIKNCLLHDFIEERMTEAK